MQTIDPNDISSFKIDLPDPEQDDINHLEFLAQLEKAWAVCDRFDLQTEIWRGRILRIVRDREKKGGEGRGAGFLHWLRDREISKTRAYGLIQLADSSDELVGEGSLDQASVNQFSKRAFIETAQSVPEVQQMISEAANQGQEITRKQVRRLTDEFISATSSLLPEEIRERTQENLLPSRIVAPLVKELSKLPDSHMEDLQESLRKEPEINCIKEVTTRAKSITKLLEASLSLRALQFVDLDLEKAMREAQRLDVLGLMADALTHAQAIEASILRFHSSWKKLDSLQERIWLESGSSTPYLRELLEVLQNLSGNTMRISLGEIAGGKRIRLQIAEESADQLDPPQIN